MDHGHAHPEHTRRRRFRGRKRYFRGVHRDAAAFQLDITPDAWWDLWHYHADWPGWGNLRWRYRVEHLRALARVFQTIADARARFATPFQLWILVSGDDAGEDAVYLHTPNANETPFPFAPPLVSAETSPIADTVRALLPGFTLDYGTHVDTHDDDDDHGANHGADHGHVHTTHWLWARGIGEPLIP
ncbi:MAG TPA: hypothetical protein VM261_08260 [Kofleriaceae bacterium]|nr:hypothetical protein [Kofleriaceae bacterium]